MVCSVGIVEWGCVGVGVKGEKGENGEDGEGTVVEGEGRMWVVEEAGWEDASDMFDAYGGGGKEDEDNDCLRSPPPPPPGGTTRDRTNVLDVRGLCDLSRDRARENRDCDSCCCCWWLWWWVDSARGSCGASRNCVICVDGAGARCLLVDFDVLIRGGRAV